MFFFVNYILAMLMCHEYYKINTKVGYFKDKINV